ncbi:unnamed protein product [Urochloa decumbens]|uniref:Uncharacterized protein n=1 Tax=Urochloa decumbens TaxID=240449 RepID=A0ABC9FGN2_9POAL
MGNCPPFPCPSPCPDLSFQEICANNNCHGCCIFHCSNPSALDEAPAAWDSPPVQLRQPPHLVPQQGSATAREFGGVSRDVVPAIGYRSPWRAEPGLLATVETRHDIGVPPPRLAAEAAGTGHDGGGLPRDGDPRASAETRKRGQPVQPARRATGRDAGAAAAADMPLMSGPARRPRPPPSPHPDEWAGSSAAAGRDDSRGVAHNPGQPVGSPTPRRALSGFAETTRAAGPDAGGAALHICVPVSVAVGSGQHSTMRCDAWSSPASLHAPNSRGPSSQGRSPSPSPSPSLPAAGGGRLSPAESRRRLPRASGAQGTT